MQIANLLQDSIVDGPGFRFTVFAQGCERNCEGCHNPKLLSKNGGVYMHVDSIIEEMLSNPLTDGLTLTGGEPFLQAGECVKIARAAKEKGLNVWVYTGYTYDELIIESEKNPEISELLGTIDVLIDGEFILSLRSLSLKWRGSSNQRIIDVQESIKTGIPTEIQYSDNT